MDVATPIGIGLALVAILVSMVMDGGNPAALIAPSSMLLVLLGTVGVSLAGVRLKDISQIIGALKSAMMSKVAAPDESIAEMVKYAEVARKEGVLALEAATRDIGDPFLKKGIQLAIDGIDGERIRELLESDIDSMKVRHAVGAKFFKDMSGFAPTIGILGTVMGLIHVLANLSNPNSLGPAISAAFTATLWGVLTANVFWLPIENKLKRSSGLEVRTRLLMVDGIMAIQAGGSPRLIEQQLLTYLAPKEREVIMAAKEANKKKAA
ncbi:MAG: motility protein A [Acidimicrobiaceae bacterium]|nr:motility protein A [Acidimicrobiaceae bacterium]